MSEQSSQGKRGTFASIETTAFSGATLLALLLGAHPDVVTIGEISGMISRDDPDTYLCSCGELIRQCPFWQATASAMAGKGYDFSPEAFGTRYDLGGPDFLTRLQEGSMRNRHIDGLRDQVLFNLPGQKQKIQKITARNVALVESILQVSNSSVFVDSAKDRLRPKALRRFSDLDVRLIHLVRRVEGVVYSQLRRGRGSDVALLARDWERRHRRLEVNKQDWPKERQILVRYEDLCRNPEQVLGEVLAFCGVEDKGRPGTFPANSQHVIGNSMRLRPLDEIKLDERWKSGLTSEQKRDIDSVSINLKRLYGYE